MKNRVLLLVPLIFSAFLQAQSDAAADSAARGKDTSRIWLAGLSFTETGSPELQRLYSALDRFQLYQPVYRASYFNTNLSNNGTAWQDLVYRPSFSSGFDPGFHTFDINYLRLQDVRWYDCQSPYTQATYVQGPAEEANFGLIHTQNIGKPVNLGIRFQRIASEGQYQRQSLSHQSLLLHTWIRPAKIPYQALIAAEYNNGVCQENGGISAIGDTLFREGIESNRKLIPVNLSDARNRIFGNGFIIRQTYDPGNRKDSVPHGFFRLQHSLQYKFRKTHFEDGISNPDYYSTIVDSGLGGVNYSWRFWDNEFALLRLFQGEKNGSIESKFFFRQQFSRLESSLILPANNFNINTINHSAGGFLAFRFRPTWGLRFQGEFFAAGFNRGDAQLAFEQWFITRKGTRLEGGMSWFRQENSYQLQRFVSNFGSWSEQQEKTANFQVFGRLLSANGNWYLSLNAQQISGFTYLGLNGMPQQLNESITFISAYLYQRLHFGKWHLYTRLLFQQNNRNQFMRLPLAQLQESFFREGKLGGKTTWRVGIDLFAVSSYRPNAYQPNSGLFYLQNNQTNNSLFQADVYVSAKIRRALAFIKFEHFNSGWGEYRVIPVPGYPLNDRALKLGLSWMFFD